MAKRRVVPVPHHRPRSCRMSSPRAPSSFATASRCCWSTGRGTTTGPSPRASSTVVSTRSPRRCARSQEETGLNVRLGPPLPDQRYSMGRRMKTVHYWVGEAIDDDDISTLLAQRRDRRPPVGVGPQGARAADLCPRPRDARGVAAQAPAKQRPGHPAPRLGPVAPARGSRTTRCARC